ncbi:serine hydrolase domain-containing protein [Microlunatus sp. GCM10028923]|uniref:serine hydrolase domain-containing protein n=1 Tax=Microlunatus sp. GCM10028923 TaxID=3273400 RepID=UPI00361E5E3C
MSSSLPRGSAAAHQVNAAGVLEFLDAMDGTPGIELHSLMLVRHGVVLAEGWWAPYRADRVHLLYSLSKSFAATAAGIAAAEGLIDLDDTLVSHFPEFEADITDPRSRAIRLRHLVTMTAGHRQGMLQTAWETDHHEVVRGFLLQPPELEPGRVFAYDSACTYALSAVVQRRAGTPLTEYLRPRLFEPLGIGEVGWLTDRPGREEGFTGLHARTEDIARLGQLYLQHGRWEGRPLVPDAWVREATRPQVDSPAESNPDWRQGYGYQFWMSRHGYRGDGLYGQFCLVLPEQDAVIAITAGTDDMQAILDGVWAHLLPAFDTAVPEPGSAVEDRLSARLESLALAPPTGASTPAGPAARWTAPTFVVADPDRVFAVKIIETGTDWHLDLFESDHPLRVRVGFSEWAITEHPAPIACAGGWLDRDTFRAEAILLETPHRFTITCSLQNRSAHFSWWTVPVDTLPLAEMCSPGPSDS